MKLIIKIFGGICIGFIGGILGLLLAATFVKWMIFLFKGLGIF